MLLHVLSFPHVPMCSGFWYGVLLGAGMPPNTLPPIVGRAGLPLSVWGEGNIKYLLLWVKLERIYGSDGEWELWWAWTNKIHTPGHATCLLQASPHVLASGYFLQRNRRRREWREGWGAGQGARPPWSSSRLERGKWGASNSNPLGLPFRRGSKRRELLRI